MRLAWVTASAVRGEDLDEPLALAALPGADVVEWHDDAVDWASYDRVVVRSTWDYHDRVGEFMAWADRVAGVTDLRNPPAMLRWSSDKHYLGELATAGVAVVPTVFLEPGEPLSSPAPVVVKPAVGAGSRDVAVCRDEAAAQAHVARLHGAGATALVQPVLASVAAEGEWPLLFFGGRYSHAANKRVALPDGVPLTAAYAPETNVPHTASAEQVAVASAAVAHVSRRFGTPTYARVDLVRGDDGAPLVLEVELVEPSLFLTEGGAPAVSRLAEALLA